MQQNKTESGMLMLGLLGFVVMLAGLVSTTFAWPFVILKFYNWFVVEQFTQYTLPIITYWKMVGLSIFITTLFNRKKGVYFKSKEQKEYFENMNNTAWLAVKVISAPWAILLLWYCFKIWILN